MNKGILIFMLLAVTAIGIREIIAYKNEYKIGYVDVNSVYESFAFKKEIEAKLIQVKQTRKNILDSMQLQLKVLANTLQPTIEKERMLFEAKRQEYFSKEKAFSEDNDALTREYAIQVMKQMNQYVQEYGSEHGYTYILGADGNGSLMFADKNKNVTTEVLEYLNDKYKGVK
jgi:outer membrane protein